MDCAKFLGVLIDSNLTWKPHILQLAQKVARHYAVLNRIRYKINAKVMLTLYDTMILPYISYCAIVWAGSATMYLRKLHIIQKKVLRLVFLANSRSHSKPIFKQLHRLTIFDIYIYITGIPSYMYLNLNSITPQSFSQTFETNSNIHSHFTRTANNLHVPMARTNVRKSALMICGPKIWNSTPLTVRKSNSEFIFKRRIKAWLLSRYI